MNIERWRDRNTLFPQQRVFCDALTCRGPFASIYDLKTRENGTTFQTPEVLYGGAGFGGKSRGLRAAAFELNYDLRERGFPGRWGVLVCKTYSDLMDRHARDLTREMGDLGRIRKTAMEGYFWQFYDPSLGGFYLRNIGSDPEQKRGAQFDWMLVDELTQLLKGEFDAVRYLLRSGDNLPYLSFGAGTNPDGIGHGWVKRLWIDRDFSDIEHLIKAGVISKTDYHFIQAMAKHNPAPSPQIHATLMSNSDPMLVKSRWEGSWDLSFGTRFMQFSRKVHSFGWKEFEERYGVGTPYQKILKSERFQLFGSLDYGTAADSASAFYLHAVDEDRNVWTFNELYMQGTYLDNQAELIHSVLSQWDDRVKIIFADPALDQPDSDGISRLFKFRSRGVPLIPAINDRIEGWATLDEFLMYRRGDDAEALSQPKWRIHEDCRQAQRFLLSAPRDEVRMEDVSRRFADDHAGDSLRYFFHSYFQGPARQKKQEGDYMARMIKERKNAKRGKTNAEIVLRNMMTGRK